MRRARVAATVAVGAFLAAAVSAQAVVPLEIVTATRPTCAPGSIIVDVLVGGGDRAGLLLSTTGDAGSWQIPGIGGVLRLQPPITSLGAGTGGRQLTLTVPAGTPGTTLYFQALVADAGGALWFSNGARSAVVAVEIRRDSPPHRSQAANVVNVGQHCRLEAVVTPAWVGAGARQSWSVPGPHIRDYTETVAAGWSELPMQAADYTGRSIAFYWQPDITQRHPNPGVRIRRTVGVRVDLASGAACSAVLDLDVDRDMLDVDLQAEDWYCEYNHLATSGSGHPPTAVLNEHADWHIQHDWLLFPRCGPQVAGYRDFVAFHGAMVARFDRWRALFGYPPNTSWDPATVIPAGPTIDHVKRNTNDPRYPLPSYLTLVGGSTPSPCFGRLKLKDLRDEIELSADTVEPWHNGVHFAVGQDMGHHATSPKDPVFWRFHHFLDRQVYEVWKR